MKVRCILLPFTALLISGSLALSQTPVIETFDYPPGDLAGNGSAENGWGGPWEVFEGPQENMIIIEESLDYPVISPSGNALAGFSPPREPAAVQPVLLQRPGLMKPGRNTGSAF